MSSTNDMVDLSRSNAKSQIKADSSDFALPESIDISKLVEVGFLVAFHGNAYLVWWKPWKTSFGEYAWGCTDMKTGKGVGGFEDWEQGCRRAIERHINQEAGQ
jgi:hypothetical protein